MKQNLTARSRRIKVRQEEDLYYSLIVKSLGFSFDLINDPKSSTPVKQAMTSVLKCFQTKCEEQKSIPSDLKDQYEKASKMVLEVEKKNE